LSREVLELEKKEFSAKELKAFSKFTEKNGVKTFSNAPHNATKKKIAKTKK
jgi:hypothetical protein